MKGNTTILLCIAFTCFINSSSSQSNFYLTDSIVPEKIQPEEKKLLDSILTIYHASENDTFRLDLLARIVENLNDDKVWPAYNNLLLQLSTKYAQASSGKKKIACLKYQATSLNNIGTTCFFKGENEKALEYYKKALELQEQCKDSLGIANTLGNTAYSYWKQGNIAEGLDYYNRSLKLFEIFRDKPNIARTLNNIALIYRQQDEITKSLEYHEKSLQILQELQDERTASSVLNNIGFIYMVNLNDNIKALGYFQRSIKIRERLNDKPGIAISLSNMGRVYENTNDLSKALDYYQKSLALREELKLKEGITSDLHSIGKIYFKQEKYPQALEAAKRSFSVAWEIGFPENIKYSASLLSDIYIKQGKWKEALEMHKLSFQMRDSVMNQETRRSTFKQQTKYEYEKKEALKEAGHQKELALSEEEKKRQRIVLFATAFGLLLVIAFAVFVANRLKVTRRQKKIIEQEQEKSEKLLLNILPKDTAQELKTTGKAKPKHYEQVTVMFTDFKGFTGIAEKLSAEELVGELDRLFKKFDEVISKYPIEKIKTIGDAYMCAGGLPSPNTTNAADVVKAAVEIQSWMDEQNNKPVVNGVGPWQLRIGIHTGSVTAGVVGDKKFAYDIWGDAVNIASRMESSGEPGKINISGATHRFLSQNGNAEHFNFTFRGKIPAKNKGEIEMYFVQKD